MIAPRFLGALVLCLRVQAALKVVEDVDQSLRYSNSGPSWLACNPKGGGGLRLTYAQSGNVYFSNVNWHESYGDGASVSFTFTGTRVLLTGASALAYYNTRLNGYIDDELKATYTNVVTDVETAVAPVRGANNGDNYHYAITLLDIADLSPGEHTFKAVSVGANSLFVVDTIQYEPSDAAPSTSSVRASSSSPGVSSAPSQTTSQTSSQTSSQSTNSTTTSQSTTSSSLSSSQSSFSTAMPNEPAVSLMDIKPSDSRIVYFPVDAWTLSLDKRRAESCLAGTISTTTPGASLTFNFTGSALQLYTVSSENGGRYSVTLDGQSRGTFDTHTDGTQLSQCSLSAQFTVEGLDSSGHSLVMTVQSPSEGSNHTAVQFVGFRLSSLTISPTVSNAQNTSHSGPPIGTIVGGTIGALILFTLIGCAFYFLKKQSKQGHHPDLSEMKPNARFAKPFHGDSTSTSIDRPLVPVTGYTKQHLFGIQNGLRGLNADVHPIPPPGSLHAERYSDSSHQEPQSATFEPKPNLTTQPPGEDVVINPEPRVEVPLGTRPYRDGPVLPNADLESIADGLTYYTLPSYQERVLERAGPRELSEADVNAISRRLREVMRQSGNMPLEPPIELVDHLVEQQLRPRENA